MLVGIETPNEAALRETTKLQNLRADRSLVDKVDAIQEAGLDVWCGLIVGFDSDDPGIFARQREFVEQSRISHAMLGMSREELRAGYVALQRERHEPGAYFDRLDRLFPAAGFRFGRPRTVGVFMRLMLCVREGGLPREYRRRLWRLVRSRPEPEVWMVYALKCAIHYHQQRGPTDGRGVGPGREHVLRRIPRHAQAAIVSGA